MNFLSYLFSFTKSCSTPEETTVSDDQQEKTHSPQPTSPSVVSTSTNENDNATVEEKSKPSKKRKYSDYEGVEEDYSTDSTLSESSFSVDSEHEAIEPAEKHYHDDNVSTEVCFNDDSSYGQGDDCVKKDDSSYGVSSANTAHLSTPTPFSTKPTSAQTTSPESTSPESSPVKNSKKHFRIDKFISRKKLSIELEDSDAVIFAHPIKMNYRKDIWYESIVDTLRYYISESKHWNARSRLALCAQVERILSSYSENSNQKATYAKQWQEFVGIIKKKKTPTNILCVLIESNVNKIHCFKNMYILECKNITAAAEEVGKATYEEDFEYVHFIVVGNPLLESTEDFDKVYFFGAEDVDPSPLDYSGRWTKCTQKEFYQCYHSIDWKKHCLCFENGYAYLKTLPFMDILNPTMCSETKKNK